MEDLRRIIFLIWRSGDLAVASTWDRLFQSIGGWLGDIARWLCSNRSDSWDWSRRQKVYSGGGPGCSKWPKLIRWKILLVSTFNFLICQKNISEENLKQQKWTDCDFATICRSLQYTGAAQLHFSICSFLSRLQRPLDNPAVHSYAYLPRNGRVWKSRMGNMHVQCITIRRIFMFKVYVLQSETWETVQCTAFSVVCSMCAPIWQTTLLPTKNGKNGLNWARIYHVTQRYKSRLQQVKIFQGSRVCHVTEEESGKWISLLWRRSPISALFHLWTPAVIIIQKLVFRLHQNLQNSSILSS